MREYYKESIPLLKVTLKDRLGQIYQIKTLAMMLAICFGCFLMWLNTGTASPYAATLAGPISVGKCNYLFNIDHLQFSAAYKMLAGAPIAEWGDSVVLRRVLYPVLAFPLMRYMGFETGGIVFNFLLYISTILLFWRYAIRRYSRPAAIIVISLLLTSPGFAYWMGSPYSYAALLPCSLFAAILFEKLVSTAERSELARICLLIGVLGLVHDSIVIFTLAALLCLLIPLGRFRDSMLAVAAMLTPLLFVQTIISYISDGAMLNSNSVYYAAIPISILKNLSDPRIWTQLAELPYNIAITALYSQFIFLPVLGLILLLISLALKRKEGSKVSNKVCSPHLLWLLSFGIVAFILNAAPMYDYPFSFRGPSYSRFYQFFYAPLLLWIGSTLSGIFSIGSASIRIGATALASAAILFQVILAASPAVEPKFAQWMYYRFYDHGIMNVSTPISYTENLTRYGFHPVASTGCPFLIPAVNGAGHN